MHVSNRGETVKNIAEKTSRYFFVLLPFVTVESQSHHITHIQYLYTASHKTYWLVASFVFVAPA